MASRLVVVPCGGAKIWDKFPNAGPTPAAKAYTGGPFSMNRKYAECFGDAWVILSAKYGFLRPEEQVPGPYNVTFKKRTTNPVAVDLLSEHVRRLGLDRFDEVVGLGGKDWTATLSWPAGETPASYTIAQSAPSAAGPWTQVASSRGSTPVQVTRIAGGTTEWIRAGELTALQLTGRAIMEGRVTTPRGCLPAGTPESNVGPGVALDRTRPAVNQPAATQTTWAADTAKVAATSAEAPVAWE